MALRGKKEFLDKLHRQIETFHKDAQKGLVKAALFVQGEAQDMTPTKTGLLVNSAFTDVENLKARVGYKAEHAPFVHEMPTAFNYTKPDTGPKFLEKAFKENPRTIMRIIRDEVKI